MYKTYMAKPGEAARRSYLIDAKDKVLGRVATKAASILRGKHRAIYTPQIDTGDQVIIINADKIKVTGKKLQDKEYHRYSGYHSGQKVVKLGDMLKHRPEKVLELAISRMIQRGPLGNTIKRKLKIYAGDQHPHQAQKPVVLDIS